MSERTRFIGLDVHKASITVAVAEAFGDHEDHGTITNDPSAVRKLMRRLGGQDIELRVAYEAGPTGYALHPQLAAMGIDCIVVAPSLIPVRPGDRIKTDGRARCQDRPVARQAPPLQFPAALQGRAWISRCGSIGPDGSAESWDRPRPFAEVMTRGLTGASR